MVVDGGVASSDLDPFPTVDIIDECSIFGNAGEQLCCPEILSIKEFLY